MTGLADLDDIHALCCDVDVALRSQHVAAGLGVALAGLDDDIALGAADRAGGAVGGRTPCVLRGLLVTVDDRQPAAGEEPRLQLVRIVRLAMRFGSGFNRYPVARRQPRATVGNHVAAADADIASGLESDAVAAEGGRERPGVK